MHRSLPALLALALAAQAPATAQRAPVPARAPRLLTQYALDHWDDRAGLPQNSVQALAQSRDGYLWLGTQAGVVRFDGVRFTTYGRDASPTLSHPYIWALAGDAEGGVWIGTEETGLVHMRGGRFTAYRRAQGLPDEWVGALHQDRRGTLWIGTMKGGVARMRGGRIEPVDSALVPSRSIYAVAEDAEGAVWIAGNRGLTRVDGARARTFGEAELGGRMALSVIPAAGGGVWVGTPKSVVRLVSERVAERHDAGDGLRGGARQLAQDADGSLWIGGPGGLARLVDGRIEPMPERGLPAAPVEALLADHEGNLWIGTSGLGLHRLADSPIVPFGALEGLPSDAVFPVLQDAAGDIWAGVTGAGLARVGADGVRRLDAAGGVVKHDFIYSIARGAGGVLWLGSPAGLTRMQGGTSTQYGAKDGIPAPLVRAVLEDRRGRVWVGTEAGVTRFRPGPPVTVSPREGLGEGFVTTLYEDADGAIWAGTRRGLSRITGAGVRTWTRGDGLPDGDVTAVHRGSDGALWIGTGAGVARLRDGRVSHVSTADGLCDDEIHAVLEDDHGRLWMSANRGIFSLSLAELGRRMDGGGPRLRCTLYGRGEGMRSRETNGAVNPAGYRLNDGRLVFPTMGGLAFVDPERLRRPRPAPAVAIEEVTADGAALERPGVLPAGTREVEVHFTALSFQAPEKIEFRYRLEGLADQWTEAGTRRSAFFTGLRPGDYRLVVQARHPGGAWSPAGAAASFRALPRLHETSWFRAIALLALSALLVFVYRARVQALKARERVLIAQVEQRTRAEARYRDLFDNATDAVLITDAGGRVTALNRRAREITGYGGAEAVGMELRALLAPETADAVAAGWLAGTGDTARMVEMISAGGEPVPVEVSTRVMMEGGRAVGTQAVARDMRDRLALERQLREAQKMEAVGQLAGGVAHDFNNLLTIIKGGAELMQGDLPAGDPMHEDVEMVLAASDRAAQLTRQLLAFSRRQVTQPRQVDVNALVTNLEPMLRRLIGEDIRITSSTCGQPAWVTADPGQLEQVLVNLAVNARDAMPGGGSLTLRTAILADCAGGDAPLGTAAGACVLLTVTDTGTGMDAVTQARVFEPFFTTKDPGKGTGLGLSTVYGIVRQAGGTIQCVSDPGQGTTFRLRLPFTGAAEPALPADTGPRAVAGTETVLLAEDEAPVRAMAARILRRHGYHVIETGGGEQALREARLHAGPIHLLLTDVVMPGMSGRVLAERLAPLRPEMRVLYMSGYTDDEMLRRGLFHPGVRYLQKPFTVDGLAHAVREILGEDAPQAGWTAPVLAGAAAG